MLFPCFCRHEKAYKEQLFIGVKEKTVKEEKHLFQAFAILLASRGRYRKYAFGLLKDYRTQKKAGSKSPIFTKYKMKEIEKDVECW